MPETARWLLAHSKEERAIKTLQWLRGKYVDIENEIVEIKDSLRKYDSLLIITCNECFFFFKNTPIVAYIARRYHLLVYLS